MLLSKLVSVASEPNECCPEQSFCPCILNAVLLQCCQWMKTQVFENDYVRVMYTSKCACSNQIWYRFYCCVITLTPYLRSDLQCEINFLIGLFVYFSLFLAKGLFTWRWRTRDRCGNMWRVTPPVM